MKAQHSFSTELTLETVFKQIKVSFQLAHRHCIKLGSDH